MESRLVSLDRFSATEVALEEPDRYRDLLDRPWTDGALIARGAGLSYVAASFGQDVVSVGMRHFNRILALDTRAGWIEVEAGITLGELFAFLTPRKLFLPVQPGYPGITVGGCIALNVHGKNQFRDGTFRSQILGITLFHPDHGILELSEARDPEILELTAGGMGLTGMVLRVRLKVAQLRSASVRVRHIPVTSLAEAFAKVAQLTGEYDLLYSWNDLSAFDRNQGRGYVTAARFLDEAGVRNKTGLQNETGIREFPKVTGRSKLDPCQKRFRPNLFNDVCMRPINRIYHALGTFDPRERGVSLGQFLFPAVGREFYFDWFGPPGFLETQMLIPGERIDAYLEDFIPLLRNHGRPVALTTIKAFRGERSLLNYDGSGFSFTLDVANRPENLAFLGNLDTLNGKFGVLSNLAKDSRLPVGVVREQYGAGYDLFRKRLREFDPKRRFVSSLSRRLEL
ncbi:MAG: FAD-binding oxidoreductase [Magnetococcales bacterium]|nr:FAD-binding oxidoreductase [Magnetococcales bacterium]